MRKDRCTIKTAKVVQNTGQFERLPRNPRQWTKEDIDKTAKSITEDADFLEDRPVLVIPRGDQYVAFAGNLRLTAAKHVKLTEVPCVVYEPESDEDWETIKRRAMKDNGSFGAWDFDALANEWDDLPLTDWGVPAWESKEEESADDFGTDFTLPDGEKEPFRQVSVLCPDEMAEVFLLALRAAQYTEDFFKMHSEEDDKTSTGVAAYIIAKWWLDAMLAKFSPKELEDAKKAKEELRSYLCDALKKSGKKASEIDALLGTNGMAGHYFGASQWMFPTLDAYTKMATVMPLERDYLECRMVEIRANMVETLGRYGKIWEDVRK